MLVGVIRFILLLIVIVGQEGVKSTMLASPSIFSVSYGEAFGEHLKTRIIDLYI